MATGEVGGSTFKDQTSDEVQDYRCSVCRKNNKDTEASHYCPDCDTCYCKACLCDHNVIGKTNMAHWGKGARAAVKTDDQSEEDGEVKCLRHPQYDVELYCVDHDVLCCQMCPSTDHRSCEDMKKLDAAAENSDINDDVQHIKDGISDLEKKVESTNRNSMTRKRLTESSHLNYLSQLREMKKKIVSKFDTVIEESYIRKKHYIDKFNTDQVLCNEIKDKLPNLKRDLDAKKDQTKYFVMVKRAAELVERENEQMDSMAQAMVRGVFENIPAADEDGALNTVADAINIRMSEMKFSVATKEDMSECEIVGICQIENGNIIIADKVNNCLKQLDDAYNVISQYKLQESPLDVCATGDAEVAVAMENEAVLLITVGTELEIVRTIDMGHRCLQIAYKNEQLYVIDCIKCGSGRTYACNCKSKIYLYNKDGELIKEINCTTGYNCHICKCQRSMAISPTGDRLYIACQCKYILSYNSQGSRVATNANCPNVVGLFVDNHGQLYASRNKPVEVIKLSKTLKKIETVMSSNEGLKAPGVMCYDKNMGRFVVGSWTGEHIVLVKISTQYKVDMGTIQYISEDEESD